MPPTRTSRPSSTRAEQPDVDHGAPASPGPRPVSARFRRGWHPSRAPTRGGNHEREGMGSLTDAAAAHEKPEAETVRAAARTRRRSGRPLVTRDGLSTLAFLLPFLVVFGVFAWFPMVRALVMSLQETNLVSDPTFVGLQNFQRVLADPLFGIAIRNTLWFMFLALVFGFPIPIILAVLMSEVRRGRGLFSALAYLPVVVPPVVAVLLWRFFFAGSTTGVFNTILGWFGLGPLPWLQDAGDVDALDRHRGDVGGRRGDGDHLPRGAARRPAGAVRRGRGRRGLAVAEDPPRDAAPAAGRDLRDADPAADRDGPAVHRAAAVHRRRAGELDDDRAAADLQVRLPEQPGRRLRHGRGAERDARRRSSALFTAGYYWVTRSWSTSS